MFGECCFNPGDVKLTMGTGSFWDINTGRRVHVSRTGKWVYLHNVLVVDRNDCGRFHFQNLALLM